MVTNVPWYTVSRALTQILVSAGVTDQNILDETPTRAYEFFEEYTAEPLQLLDAELKVFEAEHDELVLVTGIEWSSLCEHHMLPYWGTAAVGYIPNGHYIAGISKLARVVEHFTRRFTLQERSTKQIVDYLEDRLKPLAVGAILKAEHSCMSRRGVKQTCSRTTTSAMRGGFRTNNDGSKDEFLRLAGY